MLQGSFDVADGRLVRKSNHRVRVNANGVVEDDPGQHLPTAGHWRVSRVRVVKDADNRTLKGPNGGSRRKPVPADGEILADKIVGKKLKRTDSVMPNGEANPLALGTPVFRAPFQNEDMSYSPNSAKKGNEINRCAILAAQGYLDLRDIHNANLRRDIRRAMRRMLESTA